MARRVLLFACGRNHRAAGGSGGGSSTVPQLREDAVAALQKYGFPGNVRELENLLHRAVALSTHEVIEASDLGLPETLLGEAHADGDAASLPVRPSLPTDPASDDSGAEPLPTDLAAYLDEVERAILVRALRQHGFNRTAAGTSLGLSLRQMRYRMARLAITEGDDGPTAEAP